MDLNKEFIERKKWGDRRGLNPRPQESQSRALPTELRPPRDEKKRTYCISKTLGLEKRGFRREAKISKPKEIRKVKFKGMGTFSSLGNQGLTRNELRWKDKTYDIEVRLRCFGFYNSVFCKIGFSCGFSGDPISSSSTSIQIGNLRL